MDDDFLKLLRCPHTGQPLQVADQELIERANEGVAAGRVLNQRDEVPPPLDGGLVNADGQWLFPIVNEIPTLVAAEAIAVADIPQAASPDTTPDTTTEEGDAADGDASDPSEQGAE